MPSCRVCRRKENFLISMDLEDKRDKIAYMLSKFFDPTIKRQVKSICTSCSSQLKLTYKFKKKCEKSAAETIRKYRKKQQRTCNSTTDDDSTVDDEEDEEGEEKQGFESKQLKCHVCERIFKSHLGHEQHINRHRARKVQYPCLRCNLKFLAVSHLKQHTSEKHQLIYE
ncbi:uncharacterized protein LOC116344379 [Contarinia nasturtii]|uniref:uncharacterized protein LOC116344379 n=1 Tax=Contarinia nasturtii TaxID=265458 RepID=UPI0012D38251|nr:uncharacterized protein LOC116344379 [Contarinia nasturtii]